MTLQALVDRLFIGKSRVRWADRPPSAIGKSEVSSPIYLTPTGFEGDEQADLTVHGGREKAVHHYPAHYYPAWVTEFGPNHRFIAGGFGENISTRGLLEADVCIGDSLPDWYGTGAGLARAATLLEALRAYGERPYGLCHSENGANGMVL